MTAFEIAFEIAFAIPIGIALALYLLKAAFDYDLIKDLRRIWR